MYPIRIVLVGPQHPGNIGSAARAMKTMGLTELALVAPECFPHRQADAMAAGADDLLTAAQVVPTLAEALVDCHLVLGCTARSRYVVMPECAPREAAQRLHQASLSAPVALVFGRERTGLTNEELQQCHGAVHIPSIVEFSSLNLAAAVQVLSYELRLAALAAGDQSLAVPNAIAGPAEDDNDEPASHGELESMFGHLERALDAIDFHKGRPSQMVMQRLRRLFMRAQLQKREVRIVHGILADAERMARLAAGTQT